MFTQSMTSWSPPSPKILFPSHLKTQKYSCLHKLYNYDFLATQIGTLYTAQPYLQPTNMSLHMYNMKTYT